MKLSAVIFDLDGLMLGTEEIARCAWQRASLDWGYTIGNELYAKAIGRRIQDTKNILLNAFGKSFPFNEIRKRKQKYIDKYISEHGIPKKPGLIKLLNLIDELSLLKAIGSSTERKSVIRKLTLSGLIQRFDILVCGDEIQNGKPAPDIFLTTAERLCVPAEECIVLEDSENGIKAAYNAGMIPIMVPDLIQPSKKIATLTYKIFPTLNEVTDFLHTWSTGY